jgi:hypothetical protein
VTARGCRSTSAAAKNARLAREGLSNPEVELAERESEPAPA